MKRYLSPSLWAYVLGGALDRIGSRPACPACDGSEFSVVDRKGFHALHSCESCGLLFRHPRESDSRMLGFYQKAYRSGMTTDLPGGEALAELLATKFEGTEKSARRTIETLRAAGVEPGARVLDFGASWGYTAWQLRDAGYRADAFEVSVPRAEFGKRLGLDIETRLDALGTGYDAVYSGHVLEHVPNPADSIRAQIGLVRPGGVVIAYTPNGSAAWRAHNPPSFHRKWGQVHPVLLTERFVGCTAAPHACFVDTSGDLARLAEWDGTEDMVAETHGWELLFAIRRRTEKE